jgi:RsiW-degrading membrane proteinase PrsW (M82 family)
VSALLIAALALLPVLIFLGLLLVLDSYKLVPLAQLLRAMTAGALAAAAGLLFNMLLLQGWQLSAEAFVRYGAPLIEELLKALFVVHLVRTARAGFSVDAAIYGFAVGAGFAVVENIYYLRELNSPSLLLWVVRGLGTAIMHGSTTAIFAIVSKGLTERRGSVATVWFVPGWLLAAGIHSTFNHFVLPPLASTALLLAVLPPLVILVFERSASATRDWLGTGFNDDAELLELLTTGEIRRGHVGRYLDTLRESFPGPVVADMLCLLQMHVELSMRAKGILLAREAGIRVPVGEDVRPKLEELRFLRKSIGRTGMLAIKPFLATSTRDLWQLRVLEK